MEKEPNPVTNLSHQDEKESQGSSLELISDEEEDSSKETLTNHTSDKKESPYHQDPSPTAQSPSPQTMVSDNIQSPQEKSKSNKTKLAKPIKDEPEATKAKKYLPKKEFAEESAQQENPNKQRQSTSETTKPSPKKETPLKDQLIREEGQWTTNNVDSDNENKLCEDEQANENQHRTAILGDEDIDNLITHFQENQLNIAVIEKEATLKFEHWVENKHLLVLYLLFKDEIYLQFPKKANRRIDIHPANKNKIRLYGSSQQELKEISTKISEIVQKIAIVKLNIRNEEATRLKSSKLLNERLLKDKMVIFRYGNSGQRSYYLGGKGTQPQLTAVFKDIRNLKFKYFRMFDYKNTRSYSIILGHFIKQKELLKAFFKWGIKNLEMVPFIPSFGHSHGGKKDKERSLCFLMTTAGNMENFSPKDIEMSMTSFVRSSFYSIVFIFKKGEKFLPKLNVEGICFRYVFEKKFSWAYVYVMSLKKDFFGKREEIIQELEKLTEKNVIFGVRYFDSIAPERADYIKPQIYKEVPYPEESPYSSSIVARRKSVKEGEQIKEKIEPKRQVENEEGQKEEENNAEGEAVEMKQKEERGWYDFDWKKHLMSLKDKETKPEVN